MWREGIKLALLKRDEAAALQTLLEASVDSAGRTPYDVIRADILLETRLY